MTQQLFIASGVLVLYFFFYYITGSLVLHFVPADGPENSLPSRLILGFFVYHFLFTVTALPMKVLLLPLSWLSAVWAAVLAVLVLLFLIFERKPCLRRLQTLPLTGADRDAAKQEKLRGLLALLLFLTVMLIQVIWFNLNDETYAIWDQSYYVGDTATSLYTNTISQYNPYTGRQLDYLDTEYLLETYQNHSAVMSQLLHIHPMLEVLTVMASAVVILYQLIFYEIGMVLFRRDRLKSVLMVCFLFLLNMFSYNLFTAAEFLIIRPSEGKTIQAVLIIPAVLWLFLRTARDPKPRSPWIHSFLVIFGSFGLNMSSVFLIPFEISALYLPLALKKRSVSVFVRFLLLLIPVALFAAAYLFTKHGVKFHT